MRALSTEGRKSISEQSNIKNVRLKLLMIEACKKSLGEIWLFRKTDYHWCVQLSNKYITHFAFGFGYENSLIKSRLIISIRRGLAYAVQKCFVFRLRNCWPIVDDRRGKISTTKLFIYYKIKKDREQRVRTNWRVKNQVRESKDDKCLAK